MSIENSLERIANALEKMAIAKGADSEAEAEYQESLDKAAALLKSKAASTKKATSSSKKSDTSKKEEEGISLGKGDVREALKKLQRKTDAATARAKLEEFGAKTVTDLDEKLYQDLVDSVYNDLEE